MTPVRGRAARAVNELPALVVLLIGATGLVLVSQSYWRRGLAIIAGAMLLGAVLRLTLPARRVGSLVVRSRGVDVLVLGGLGAATLLLAIVIPATG